MYRLIIEDADGNTEKLYESDSILDIDCFTGEFADRDDFLEKVSERLERTFKSVYIESLTKDKVTHVNGIMYENYVIPDQEVLVDTYALYLFNDRNNFKRSFLYNVPRFKYNNIDDVTLFEIKASLQHNMDTYRKKRDCYFELINAGKIKVKKNKEKKEDYLSSLIHEIDIDEETDQSIMIEKILDGEEEPNFYDLDDYVSMKKRRKK